MPDTQHSLIAFCRDGNRVCPLPQHWNTLFEMLPHRRRTALGWEPALPLILQDWDSTPAALKALRLAEHIEWAAANGALDAVSSYLRGLPESGWLHS